MDGAPRVLYYSREINQTPHARTHAGFHSVTDVPGMCIVTGMMGFLRAWLHVPIALVLAEHLDVERFVCMRCVCLMPRSAYFPHSLL